MFVQGTRDLEHPYHRLRPALIDGPSWLGSLASPALIEVLELTSTTPFATDLRETLGRVRDAFACEVGPIRLHVDAITVPIRCLSPLDPWFFPTVLDADLHLTRLAQTHSQLTLNANYPRPEPPANPDLIHHTVQAMIDTYLRDVTTTLNDQTT